MSRMMKRVARLSLALSVVALGVGCDGGVDANDATYTPWEPSVETVAPSAATPSGCDDQTRTEWRYVREAGRVVSAARAEGAAAANRTERYTFDDLGQVLEVRVEEGTAWSRVQLERDAAGRVVRRVADCDGCETSAVTTIERTSDVETVISFEGDLVFEAPPLLAAPTRSIALGAAEDLGFRLDTFVTLLIGRGDLELNLTPFSLRETRRQDDAGRLEEVRWDVGQDGQIDFVERWGYVAHDDGGRSVTWALDWDADGVSDRARVQRFDAEGRVVETRTTDASGERVVRLRYGAAGAESYAAEPLEETTLSVVDGTEQLLARTTRRMVSGEDGLTEFITETDADADGAMDAQVILYLRPDGQRVLKQEDHDADGVFDWQRRYVYRADGLRAFSERDQAVNGRVDERWDYGYEAGELVVEVKTSPGSATCAGLN